MLHIAIIVLAIATLLAILGVVLLIQSERPHLRPLGIGMIAFAGLALVTILALS